MAKKSLVEKCQKEFPDFTQTADSMNLEQLDQRMLTYAKELQNTVEAEAKDNEEGDLGKAKEVVKELGAPYKETKKALHMKMGYLASLIKEKGGKEETREYKWHDTAPLKTEEVWNFGRVS